MWPFSTRGTRCVEDWDEPGERALDYTSFRNNDACIKLWLPEKLSQALDQLSAAQDASRPDVLRGLLFEHVYGRWELENLSAWKRQQDAEEARRLEELKALEAESPPMPKFSTRRSNTIQMLGKATEDIKLWLPQPLKEALLALAKNSGMGISDYIRKHLVRILLGEHLFQQWQRAIESVPAHIREEEAREEV